MIPHTPEQRLNIYRAAVLIQCFTIFAVSLVNFRYQRDLKESTKVVRQASATIDELMKLVEKLSKAIVETNGWRFIPSP